MRIAELSRQSGVSVPTIKYYVRESLLPAGELTSPNQAQYDDSHLRRLKLIRALVDVGGLSITATRDVLASIDAPGKSLHDTLGKAQYATTPRRAYDADDQARAAAVREVDELIGRRGWQIKQSSPARRLLAEAVSALRGLGHDDLLVSLDDYADAAERIAAADVNAVLRRPDIDSMLEALVVGTILGDTLLAALRRLAHESVSAQATPDAAANRAGARD
jgi:DNA-binding transcriptional MerR regulator